MSSKNLTKQHIDSLTSILNDAGPNAPLLRSLIFQFAEHLIRQQFVLEKRFWSENSSNERLHGKFLEQLFGKNKNWDEEKILGHKILPFLKEINNEIHSSQRSIGASTYKEKVVKRQGGEFCILCGSLKDIEVDHIKPVKRSGDQDDIKNMQLLCKLCNSAKKELAEGLMPQIIKTETLIKVSASKRFRFLLEKSILDKNGMNMGVCGCGQTSKNQKLNVIVRVKGASSNFLNLKIVCDKCEGGI
jgi:hypothetical protein